MKSKKWLVWGIGLALFAAGSSAAASVTRSATGRYVFTSTTIRGASGQVLRQIAPDPMLRYTFPYVTAIGRYGGRYSASGRKKAKSRAVTKVLECTSAMFAWGLLSSGWRENCGRAEYSTVTDPDMTLIDDWYAYYYFENIAQQYWCPSAVQVAQQAGETGPVTITGDVSLWGDAAGTESDRLMEVGSYTAICYY